MRLNADGMNRNTCIQAVANNPSIFIRQIKIVNQKCRIRICCMCSIKHLFNKRYSTIFFANSCDCIVISIINRHDYCFIYDIPFINFALKCRYIAFNTCKLLLKNRLVIIFHEPRCTYRMPAKRMSLQRNTMFQQKICCIHSGFVLRMSLRRLIIAPIKRKCRIIKNAKPLIHTVFIICLIMNILIVIKRKKRIRNIICKRNGVKATTTK